MKGKSKSKKILHSNKPKVSIENMYKKYKSQESYNELKILTRNFQKKINLPKQNIGGNSPTNNNNISNSQNNNSINNISNKNNNKISLKFKNFCDTTTTSSNNNYFKLISPSSLRMNILTNNNKNTNEKLEKNTKKLNFPTNILQKNCSDRKINKNKLTDNSFELDEVNCENKINYNEEFQNKIDINKLNNSNEYEKFQFSNRSANCTNKQVSNKNSDKAKRKNSNYILNSDRDNFKLSNNFYTNSICEGTESFLEKGDKNLINNVPDTFVRQTENKLFENTSSKKWFGINDKVNKSDTKNETNTKNIFQYNSYNKKNDKKSSSKMKISIELKNKDNEIDSDSLIFNRRNQENISNEINKVNNKNERIGDLEKTPKKEFNKINYKNNTNEPINICNNDSFNKIFKTQSANKIDSPVMNLLSEFDLAKNFSENILEFKDFNYNTDVKMKKKKYDDLQFCSPSEKCYRRLIIYSKKGDKESFLETLSELYSLEKENINIHYFDESGQNCMHIACDEGNLKIVEILVKLNFNLDMKDKQKDSKKTALHISCEKGYFDISKILLERGAQINVLDAKLNTPLHLCALYNHVELFQFLLEKSANYELKNNENLSAFDIIFKKNEKSDTIEKFKRIINEFKKNCTLDLKGKNKELILNSSCKMEKKNIKDLNSSNSKSSNRKHSQLMSINMSNLNTIEKNNYEIKNTKDNFYLKNSNKNSSKELSYNSNFINNFNTVNTSNMISDISTNINNFSKKDSSNISNSQFSNFKSNFKNYKKNNDRSSNTNNFSNSKNNFSLKNILNPKTKYFENSNSKAKIDLEKSNQIKILNLNLEDLTNSSYNSKINNTKKIDNSLMSNNCNSNSISTKFKKIELSENVSSDINNVSNSNSNDIENFYSNIENNDCLKNLNENKKICVSDFYCHLILGKGSFGEVYLVEEKSTYKFYAMKILKKEKIIGLNLIRYALTERNILSITDHPFIVKLHYSFQSVDKLFLILDFCPGGDLSEHLTNKGKLSEEIAKIYLCEIILALEDLHKKDIIFRDLKPDNIVLDSEGHALLTDFGLSKEGVYDNIGAKSFCGSIAYLAPEMLSRTGHGKSVDWYLLGVVFYELLVGLPPYFNLNKDELLRNIVHGKATYPDHISPLAVDLLKKAHLLNNYNLELVKSLDGLKERRENLIMEINKEEEKKIELEKFIEKLKRELINLDDNLDKNYEIKADFDRVINNTENAYNKLLESSQTLLIILKNDENKLHKKLKHENEQSNK